MKKHSCHASCAKSFSVTRGITGVIVASHRIEVDAPLKFDWERFSAVKIDVLPHEPQLHHVTNDQRAIVQLAVRRDPEVSSYNPLALWDTHFIRELDDSGYIDRLYQ